MRTHPTLLVVSLAVTLSGLALGIAARADVTLPALPGSAPLPGARGWNPRQTPVVEVVRRVKSAVVNIHSERTVRAPAAEELFSLTPSQNRVNGMGTGIVVDPRGYIITNQHVVEDVSLLRVRLADGTTLTASVAARDSESDLALLKINPPKPLPVMPLGTTRDLQVGETVVAIGNAYGYDHTVTVGVVSATGRDVTLNKQVSYRALIQTDASINPGNSGGPLINLNGELVGVNVAIRAGAQGIGFAIPVDTMITVGGQLLAQVRARGQVAPLGMVARDEVNDTAASRRVLVDRIDGGPAGKAGLHKGDVLVRVGEVPVRTSLDVQRGLLDREAGHQVDVVVQRDGSERRLQLTLEAAARPAERQTRPIPALTSTAQPASNHAQVYRVLGLRLSALSNTAEVTRSHPQLHGGLLVKEVRTDSPAARAGLRQGDILVGLHQWEMLSLDNVMYVLNHPDRRTFGPLQFYILRGGQVHRGWVQLAP
jgi:serine protease Do